MAEESQYGVIECVKEREYNDREGGPAPILDFSDVGAVYELNPEPMPRVIESGQYPPNAIFKTVEEIIDYNTIELMTDWDLPVVEAEPEQSTPPHAESQDDRTPPTEPKVKKPKTDFVSQFDQWSSLLRLTHLISHLLPVEDRA